MIFLVTKNIEILPWPANSPDLNPIQNVWNDIKKPIRNEKVLPRTKAELKSVITRFLDNFLENTEFPKNSARFELFTIFAVNC